MEQAEKLLLQLPGAVLGQLAAEVGGAAQSELHALLAQLLKELVAAMQPAAANRDALSPIMARPSRCLVPACCVEPSKDRTTCLANSQPAVCRDSPLWGPSAGVSSASYQILRCLEV